MDYIGDFKRLQEDLGTLYSHRAKDIVDYDGVIDYMNMITEKASFKEEYVNCQPINHRIGPFRLYKEMCLSNCVIQLKFKNMSSDVLEDYKVYLQFENVKAVDTVNKNTSATDFYQYRYNVRFDASLKGEFNPARNVLVQNDSVVFDSICLRPDYKKKSLIIKWELFARNAYNSGMLSTPIHPIFEKTRQEIFVDDVSEERFFTRILPKIVIE